MQQYEEQAYYGDIPVAQAADEVRASFLRRTYGHLAGAIAGIALLDFALIKSGVVHDHFLPFLVNTPMAWLIVMGVFWLVSHIATRWVNSEVSRGQQYAGLVLYSVVWAFLVAPMLVVAQFYAQESGTNIIGTAAIITAAAFGGLSAFVFVTGKDFSFLRGILAVLSFGALGLIICSMIFGFSLGIVFTVAMIVLMCGYIVYETSLILHHIPADKHVAAALLLLGSVMTLFWYVLRLVMYLSNRD